MGLLPLAVIAGLTRLCPLNLECGGHVPDTPPIVDVHANSQERAQTARTRRAAQFKTPALSIDSSHFPQESVFGNPNCRMTVHSGAEGGIAPIVLPGSDGARFATLDANGLAHKGDLPFQPEWFSVVRRADGSVLTAFTDITYMLLDDGSSERRGFAQVFLDGQPLLEHDMVWDLQVAPDGSSFYFVESVQGDTSQMVIHNLDLDLKRKYFLDTLYYAPPSSHRYYSGYYSLDRSPQLIFQSGVYSCVQKPKPSLR